jgi:chitodextrinase
VPGTTNVTVHLGSAASDNTGVVAYDVYRDGTYLFSVPAGVTSWTDAGVPGGTHTWTVRARDQRGNQSLDSAASGPITIADTVPPSAPGQPSATVGAHKVTLTWAAATDDVGVIGYDVYRDGVLLTATSVTGTSYVDTTVAQLTTYSYTVRAVDVGNNLSPFSPPGTVSTPDWTAPSAPTVSASGAGPGKVTVKWTGASDNVKVTGYDVYRDGKVAAAGLHAARWTDANLQPGSQHRYRVVATDAAGNRSASSNIATVTAPPITPFVHINRTPANVAKQATFTVYGAVSPAVAHTVLLQEYRPATRTWVTVRQGTTGMRSLPNGNHAVGYAFTLSKTTAGSYSYRVVWQAGGGYAGVTTRAVRVTVH